MKNDSTLIRYLMRHRHTTPFEMAELKFLIRCPMDLWRQWIRHRTASVNEYSTRYSEAIDANQKTPADQWRMQSGTNKQGSSGTAGVALGELLTDRESQLHKFSREVYQERINNGIAREQARKDLPLSTYTEAYWKIDLHNLLHFLGLRMHSHAQKEIRDYATIIGEQIVKPLFPIVWEAFYDYHPHMGGMMLSRLDILAVQTILQWKLTSPAGSIPAERANEMIQEIITNKREREECIAKLQKMGIVV